MLCENWWHDTARELLLPNLSWCHPDSRQCCIGWRFPARCTTTLCGKSKIGWMRVNVVWIIVHWNVSISFPPISHFPPNYIQQNELRKAKKEFPLLGEAPSQVLQTTIRRLHDAWNYFQERGFGFPRFQKFGQMKSMLFPQFKTNPITGWQISLPKVGKIPINLHRPIPEGWVTERYFLDIPWHSSPNG